MLVLDGSLVIMRFFLAKYYTTVGFDTALCSRNLKCASKVFLQHQMWFRRIELKCT